MEGLALTGAWVDRDQGLLSTIVLEMGGSSDLCTLLEPGEPVILMGPTGTPTETPGGETVLLVGGGLGNAVLFSIGQALREQRLARCSISPATSVWRDRYKVEPRSRRAADIGGVVLRRGAGFPARPASRTAPSSAISWRRCGLWHGRAGAGADSAGSGRPAHRHRLGRA